MVLLTKNEHDLINDFIMYYGYLFGINNIIIVDNGSTDDRVLSCYEKYMADGLTVITENRSFSEASQFMTEHIHGVIKNCKDVEWILCLETDEFLFWTQDMINKIDRTAVSDYLLDEVDRDITYLRYEKFWGSIVNPSHVEDYVNGASIRPACNIVEFMNQNWDKFIVRADAFVAVTQWPHHADISYGRKVVCEELGLLHFHNTGKRRLFEKACNVLESIGICTDIARQFQESPEEIFTLIDYFYRTRGAHAHKAGYVKDVLLRALCWHTFVYAHNTYPSKHFIDAATATGDLNVMKDAIRTWQGGDNVSDVDFVACVYCEDMYKVESKVETVRNTLKYLENDALPKDTV